MGSTKVCVKEEAYGADSFERVSHTGGFLPLMPVFKMGISLAVVMCKCTMTLGERHMEAFEKGHQKRGSKDAIRIK